jgi:hypothetical protein
MDKDEVGGIIRAGVATVGGILIATGKADAAIVSTVGGGLITLATALWSIKAKRKAKRRAGL